jgi:threonine/homoserine/homoserine lactone efflux protein
MLFQRTAQGPARPAKASFRGRNFLAGFAICLGNPKVILFYLGFFPAFMDLTRLTGWDALVVLAAVGTVASGTLLLYVAAADRARRIFTGRRFVNGWRRSMGAIMIGAGAWVAAD